MQDLQTGRPRSSSAGASIEAPKGVGCEEGVSPSPLGKGLGSGQCPILRKFL